MTEQTIIQLAILVAAIFISVFAIKKLKGSTTIDANTLQLANSILVLLANSLTDAKAKQLASIVINAITFILEAAMFDDEMSQKESILEVVRSEMELANLDINITDDQIMAIIDIAAMVSDVSLK